MPSKWTEERAQSQREYREWRRSVKRSEIAARLCLTCWAPIGQGERATRRYCSDRCRIRAHRLQQLPGWWERALEVRDLYMEGLRILALAAKNRDREFYYKETKLLQALGNMEAARASLNKLQEISRAQEAEPQVRATMAGLMADAKVMGVGSGAPPF